MKVILNLLFVLTLLHGGFAQRDSRKQLDCTHEKDRVFIDWTNGVNRNYIEKEIVRKLSKAGLRSLYCQNLSAKERLENGEPLETKGGFVIADEKENYLVFSIDMGDLVYSEKLYMHVGPRQRMVSK